MGANNVCPQTPIRLLLQGIKSQYSPGDMIRGKAIVQLQTPVVAHSLSIKLIGREISSYKPGFGHVRQTADRIVIQQMVELIDFKNALTTQETHCADFKFKISLYLPSSFSYQSKLAEAHIAYSLHLSFLGPQVNKELSQPFLLCSRPIEAKRVIPQKCLFQNSGQVENCLLKGGNFSIQVKRNQEFFFTNDRAQLILSMFNDCQTQIDKISIEMIQRISFQRNSKLPLVEVNSSSKYEPGIQAGRRLQGKQITVELWKLLKRLDTTPPKLESKLEETLSVQFMQPTVRTPLLSCQYFIKVKGLFGSSLGCRFGSPQVMIPIKLGVLGKNRRTEYMSCEDESTKVSTPRRSSRSGFDLGSTDRTFKIRL